MCLEKWKNLYIWSNGILSIGFLTAKGSKKTNKDQKTKSRDQKKQIRIKKTNKDDRSENRQETAEREDQKKLMGIHMNKNERE